MLLVHEDKSTAMDLPSIYGCDTSQSFRYTVFIRSRCMLKNY